MTDARVSAAAVEALTNGTPARRVSASSVEALTNGTPERRVTAASLEVLAPSALVTTPAYTAEVMADNPGGYWPLDEPSGTTFADASGAGVTGTWRNVPTLGAGPLILTGRAATLNRATNDYGDVGDATTYQYTNALTVEAWFKPSTVAPGYYGIVVRPGTPPADPPWSLYQVAASIEFHCNTPGGVQWLYVDDVLVAGTTYHVVATCNQYIGRLYLNGACVASLDYPGKLVTTGGTAIEIGRLGTSSFSGRLDEIAVYPTALSPTRVAAHYYAGTGGTPPPAKTGPLVVARPKATATMAGSSSAYGTNPLTNHARNPSMESPTPLEFWLGIGSGASIALDTTKATHRAQSVKVSNTGAITAAQLRYPGIPTGDIPAGRQVTLAWDYLIPASDTNSTSLRVQLRDDVAAVIFETTTVTSSPIKDGAWHRQVYRTTVPAGRNLESVYFALVGTAGTAREWNGDAFVITDQWTDGAYFDGDTPDTAADSYVWTGAPNQSTSQRITSLSGPLVATRPKATASSTGTSTPPALAGTLVLARPPATATATGTALAPPPLDGTLVLLRAKATATATAYLTGLVLIHAPATVTMVGTVLPVDFTDQTFGNEGYSYTGEASVTYDPPVVPDPPGITRAEVLTHHQHLPPPVLVNGRPT